VVETGLALLSRLPVGALFSFGIAIVAHWFRGTSESTTNAEVETSTRNTSTRKRERVISTTP
jgi:hypothetical protein